MTERSVRLSIPRPHPAQLSVMREADRFNVLVAGRRFGKTVLGMNECTRPMLEGKPTAFFSPTYKNLSETWRAMVELLQPMTIKRSEGEHRIQIIGGGTVEMWSLDSTSADAIRGRKYAMAVLDECAVVPHLLDTWNFIIRPTLLDYAGGAWFISTPKGRTDFHKMYEWGRDPAFPEWRSWRRPTSENPYIPPTELEGARQTMPLRAFEQEIEARFIDEVTGALFRQADIDANRVSKAPPLTRIVVAIDPAGSVSRTSDETGIVAVGLDENRRGYVLADASGTYSPDAWARKAIGLYELEQADCIIAENNYGGDMVKHTLKTVDPSVPIKIVHAARGKAIRAEPIAAAYEQGRVAHVGRLDELEMQMTTWSPADDAHSPDRLDALVWGLGDLLVGNTSWTPEQHAAYARGDDLHGPEWGDAEPAAAGNSDAAAKEQQYLAEVEALQAAQMRGLVGR